MQIAKKLKNRKSMHVWWSFDSCSSDLLKSIFITFLQAIFIHILIKFFFYITTFEISIFYIQMNEHKQNTLLC